MFMKNLVLLIALTLTNGERLHEQIYSSIEGAAACFRRLNGTHQAGCSSSDNGAVGVVQMITDVRDAQWIVYNATAGPYMAVVSTAMFYDVIELFMSRSVNVAGILLYDNATIGASAFTQDSRCPNEYASGPGSQCSSTQAGGFVWNEKGSGLLRRDIPFPVFYLPESRFEEIDKIDDCYKRYNLDRNNQRGKPLCSLQLNSFMFAAVNSEVCIRRSASTAILTATKVCDPLGDFNVYYSLFPRKQDNETKNESVTLVTARIDTASLFDGISPGAASSVVGLVTLLSAAVTLSQLIPVTDAHLYKHNILFTFFNGEAFDYIGSQRVAYDLREGVWPPSAPLSPSDIKLHIELGQIGGSLPAYSNVSTWPLYAFAPYDSFIVPEINNFINLMETNVGAYNMSLTMNTDSVTNLPPSSLHSFRKILTNLTETGKLPELLLTDHSRTFTNMFYNSALDEYEKIGFAYHNISVDTDGTFLTTEELLADGTMKDTEMQVKIARLATALSRTLYQRVVGAKYTGDITSSAHLVDEMLYCFLRSQSCRLLLAADYATTGGGDAVAPRPPPLYVGVATWAATAPVFTGHLLTLLAGQHLAKDKDACNSLTNPGFSYYWLKGWNHTGECFQTTMNFSQAVSPAFVISDYNMSSGVYSTWTESVWQAMWARVFVSSGGGGARAAAGAGAAATLLALILTAWVQQRKDLLLPAPTLARDDATSGILRTVNC